MANLSKIRREKMLEYLEKLKATNNDDEHIRAITEIENALNEKKYGLVWEEHSEKVDEMLEHNIPVFVENVERKIEVNENEAYNFLLEGDNLHSLKLLEKTHKGKIDVIYIDPPYNTGNKDFIYDDSFIDKTDGYAHSKWLSFMEKRLIIARKLLSDDGVIFISIDENECHQLKMLLDNIFSENNFVGEFIWKARSGKSGTNSLIATSHEYIYCYSKRKESVNFFAESRITESNKKEALRQWGQNVYREDRPTMFFPIFYKEHKFEIPFESDYKKIYRDGCFDDEFLKQLINEYCEKGYEFVLPMINNKYGRWRKSYSGVKELINDNLLSIEIDSSNEKVIKKIIPSGKTTTIAVDSILEDFGTASNGTLEIKKIFFGEKVFDTTKPIKLIKRLIFFSIFNKSKATALDFFAGSGTTGHAVMQLNKEDGGNRKYILCTNNENNICEEVTYQRLKNIQSELPHNLKYFKTDFIPKFTDNEDSVSDKIMDHIQELIELEHALEIDGRKYIIISDEDKLDKIISDIEDGGKLFVRSGIFLTRNHQRLLEEKDVSIIEIPEYYFREELKEIGEL